ncbi:hypothetical protein [Nitrosomonas ureae]|uniref:hypothetical protein n=1 Tax=Nitrosomonas ureae TaxID=44577 RepID=UPI000CDEB63D|nr:hypothetical protein [Nitrosomonas ureae]
MDVWPPLTMEAWDTIEAQSTVMDINHPFTSIQVASEHISTLSADIDICTGDTNTLSVDISTCMEGTISSAGTTTKEGTIEEDIIVDKKD